MLPDRVSNPGPLTYELGALPIALRGPASIINLKNKNINIIISAALGVVPRDSTTSSKQPW